MLWPPFRQIKEWFAFPQKQKDLAAIIAYIRVGALEDLLAYQKAFLPYRSDTDTGEPDGKYDKTQEYNGAELTIILGGGDCESLAGFFSEVIRWWKGWESWHVCFVFTRVYNKYEAHDVCFFKRPNGSMGWMEAHPTPESNAGGIYEGGYEAFRQHYDLIGWEILDWWKASDTGEKL